MSYGWITGGMTSSRWNLGTVGPVMGEEPDTTPPGTVPCCTSPWAAPSRPVRAISGPAAVAPAPAAVRRSRFRRDRLDRSSVVAAAAVTSSIVDMTFPPPKVVKTAPLLRGPAPAGFLPVFGALQTSQRKGWAGKGRTRRPRASHGHRHGSNLTPRRSPPDMEVDLSYRTVPRRSAQGDHHGPWLP